MGARIQSLSDFWPVYLTEHRDPRSRALHFVGTTLAFAAMGLSLVWHPVGFCAAMLVMAALGWWAVRMETTRAAFLPLVGVVVVGTIASPLLVPLAVVSAYTFAWVGHFEIEHNRPATFKYPVWSFLCDIRMWSHMARGRLWSGDPNEALGVSSGAGI